LIIFIGVVEIDEEINIPNPFAGPANKEKQ